MNNSKKHGHLFTNYFISIGKIEDKVHEGFIV